MLNTIKSLFTWGGKANVHEFIAFPVHPKQYICMTCEEPAIIVVASEHLVTTHCGDCIPKEFIEN
jgi:hypothetical protein